MSIPPQEGQPQEGSVEYGPRVLFIDMNSFFASVEQQENPELRGKPIIVAPMIADTTCAIAASYEAKAFGIKTGTMVRDAKRMCPGLVVVSGHPHRYVAYHDEIVEVLNHYFVTIHVLSVDEMACVLSPRQIQRGDFHLLVQTIKNHIKKKLGGCMRCSVGIAPNIFLAKLAADFKKPDAHTFFLQNYQEKLFELELRDLPGIGQNMERHCALYNVNSVRELWNSPIEKLRNIWGGVVGDRWYYMLRGSLESDYGNIGSDIKKSVSHSHVLAPELRTLKGAKDIMLLLSSKALKRLRSYGQSARVASLSVSYRHKKDYADRLKWHGDISIHTHANDDMIWLSALEKECKKMPEFPGYVPCKCSVYFLDLAQDEERQLSLFDDREEYTKLFHLIDSINERYGHTVDVARVYSMKNAKKHAPFRISFGKPGEG
jgi:DNA polymerase-4